MPVKRHCICRWLDEVVRRDAVADRVQVTLCVPICRQGDEQGGHLFFWGGHLGDLHPGASSPERQPAGHRVRFLQCLPSGQIFRRIPRVLLSFQNSCGARGARFDEAKRGHGARARAVHQVPVEALEGSQRPLQSVQHAVR